MRKGNIAIIALIVVTITATAAFAQSHQIVKAEIPFSFSVRGENYSAGEYTIKRTGDAMHIWAISGSNNNISSKVLLSNTINASGKEQLKITFRRYNDQYFLVAFTTASYRVNLPKSKSERQLQKKLKSEGQLAKAEIINLDANAD